MIIHVLRHGIAAVRDDLNVENDSERQLTPKGKRQLRQTAAAMKKMGLRFDLILSSPYLRAKQTAEIVAESLKLKQQLRFSNALAPDGSPKNLIRQLNELKPVPENVLLVGHEPYLSSLISLLTTGHTDLMMDFKKGGLCKLEAGKLSHDRCATLVWLFTPLQMKLMH
ncbi:MAG: phosphohistidine phosphatase SixA [Verrucomicrobiota bacterium]|jgi:phosphohistidine phosphatase